MYLSSVMFRLYPPEEGVKISKKCVEDSGGWIVFVVVVGDVHLFWGVAMLDLVPGKTSRGIWWM